MGLQLEPHGEADVRHLAVEDSRSAVEGSTLPLFVTMDPRFVCGGGRFLKDVGWDEDQEHAYFKETSSFPLFSRDEIQKNRKRQDSLPPAAQSHQQVLLPLGGPLATTVGFEVRASTLEPLPDH